MGDPQNNMVIANSNIAKHSNDLDDLGVPIF